LIRFEIPGRDFEAKHPNMKKGDSKGGERGLMEGI
jgi:hypothetical protein